MFIHVSPTKFALGQNSCPVDDTELDGLCLIVKNQIKEKLKDIQFGAGTSDCWSSFNMDSFMCVTLHYIDKDWNLCRVTPAVLELNGSHTGQKISAIIRKEVSDVTNEKFILSAVTHDNGSDENKSCDIIFGDEEGDVRCIAHTMQLSVIESLAISLFNSDILKARYIVKKIRKCQKLRAALKNLLKDEFIELVLDCVTRWGSMYEMLEAFYKKWPQLKQTHEMYRSEFETSFPDVNIIEAFIKVGFFSSLLFHSCFYF